MSEPVLKETEAKTEEKKIIWSKKERDTSKENYGCEIVVENGSKQDIHTKEAPTDCLIVTYEFDGEIHQDLTRGTRVAIFDMYYDKFKKGLKEINWGKGTISPKVWGYTSKTPKKKK